MNSFFCKPPMLRAASLKAAPLLAAVLLTSCATQPAAPVVIASEITDTAALVGNAEVGDVVRLPVVNNQLGENSVVVTSQYTAASGKQCRRLSTVDARALPRIVCRSATGRWFLGRQLQLPVSTNIGLRQVRMANMQVATSTGVTTNDIDAQPVSLTELQAQVTADVQASSELSVINSEVQISAVATPDSAIKTVERAIDSNETLWTFAKRTTGNALNWQQIATLNSISDPALITSGQIVLVPATLVRDAN